MPRIRTTGWAMAPWPLMDQMNEPGGKQRLLVYLMLHKYGHGSADGCWVSTARLAVETGIKRDDVCLALAWLVNQGWIEREARPGKTSVYFVKADAPTPQKVGTPRKRPTPQKVGDTYPPKGDTTYPPKGDTNKNPLTRTQEQEKKTALEGQAIASDGPAKGQVIADGDRDQGSSGSEPAKGPVGTNPRARGENPRASSRAFAPSEADIPASLLPVQTELIGFWKHKGGKRNAVAWSFLLGQLEQIQGHIEGGTDVVRCQLTRGIAVVQAGGKPWTSVTFDNWQRYGRTTDNNQARGRPIPGRTPEGLTLTEAFRLEGLIP